MWKNFKVVYKDQIKKPDLFAYVLKNFDYPFDEGDEERIIKNELFRLNGFNTIYSVEEIEKNEVPEDVEVLRL